MANKRSAIDMPFLLVGGASRCGTTSIYRYLIDHPDVCGGRYKESGFFLADYHPADVRYVDFGPPERLARLFEPHEEHRICVDATAETLISPGGEKRIEKTLRHPKFLFVLRDPIDRFTSCYRYYKQRGFVSSEETLWRFFENQKTDLSSAGSSAQLALLGGLYHHHLRKFYHHFNPDQIIIIWFDELCSAPHLVMRRVAEFCGIDPEFYASYEFKPQNPSVNVRWPMLHYYYRHLIARIRMVEHLPKSLRGALRTVNRTILEPISSRVFRKDSESFEISGSTLTRLAQYYIDDSSQLEKLVGHPPPWKLRLETLVRDAHQ
jgi:hypothetical protein